MKADLVIKNAKVITVDKDFSIKQAIAVKNRVISAVGSNNEIEALIGEDTEVLDLEGKSILPGINDSHLHTTFFGATRPPLALNLRYPAVKSIPDMVEILRLEVAKSKPGEWIRGFGWDQGTLEECGKDPSRLPRKADIDGVSPDNPVVFTDFSGHTMLINSYALKLAGITRDTPSPDGGLVEKDPDTGEPTGIFLELSAQALVSSIIPLFTREEKKAAMLSALKHFNSNGITSFTDAAVGPGGDYYVGGVMGEEIIDIYSELLAEENLTARATVLLLFGEYGALTFEDMKSGLAKWQRPLISDENMLQVEGVKIFADGIPPTKTAWMREDYIGGGCGALVIPGKDDKVKYEELVNMIVHAHELGFQVGVHATGDRAIDAAIDGFEKAEQVKPGQDLRHYTVHSDFLHPESIERILKLNCGVSMQPEIKSIVADIAPAMVGEERSAWEFPMASVAKAGVNLSASSDAPVTYPNWLVGVQAAVLRESVLGKVSGPEECISVKDAIRTYTMGGAWQDNMDNLKGSIEPGKKADFCCIDKDILTIDPHEISAIKVTRTIVDGKTVFELN